MSIIINKESTFIKCLSMPGNMARNFTWVTSGYQLMRQFYQVSISQMIKPRSGRVTSLATKLVDEEPRFQTQQSLLRARFTANSGPETNSFMGSTSQFFISSLHSFHTKGQLFRRNGIDY